MSNSSEVLYKDSLVRRLESIGQRISDSENTYATFKLLKVDELLNLDMFTLGDIENIFQQCIPYVPEEFVLEQRRVFIIYGAGGVTSWLLPQLIKILYNASLKFVDPLPYHIFVCDGDSVEDKNLLRQNFIPEDIDKNKASVLAERYNLIYDNVHVHSVPYYIVDYEFVRHYLEPGSLETYNDSNLYLDCHNLLSIVRNESGIQTTDNVNFINAVDNEQSKHMLDFYLSSNPNKEYLYFSTGCHEHGGNVFWSHFSLDQYSSYYKDTTFKEEDAKIHTLSCAEIAEQATVEQSFNSNSMAANLLAVLIDNVKPYYYSRSLLPPDTKEITFVSTGKPHVSNTSGNLLRLTKIFSVLIQVYQIHVKNYLNRWGSFKETPTGNFYSSLNDLIQKYTHLEDN